MWRIKQMMTLNNGSFLAIFGDDIQVVDKIKYATNIFSLTFKKN
jgi:TusA-related sulfurtransferase